MVCCARRALSEKNSFFPQQLLLRENERLLTTLSGERHPRFSPPDYGKINRFDGAFLTVSLRFSRLIDEIACRSRKSTMVQLAQPLRHSAGDP
jgi:hypothetical protein